MRHVLLTVDTQPVNHPSIHARRVSVSEQDIREVPTFVDIYHGVVETASSGEEHGGAHGRGNITVELPGSQSSSQ